MKTCETCGREYLDSYESCPFCARSLVPAEHPARAEGTKGSRAPLWIGLGAVALLVAAVVGWQAVASRVASTTVGRAQQAACFAEQLEAERAAVVHSATHDDERVKKLSALVPAEIEAVPACPYGGTFTMTWGIRDPKVTCSKHGWNGDQR